MTSYLRSALNRLNPLNWDPNSPGALASQRLLDSNQNSEQYGSAASISTVAQASLQKQPLQAEKQLAPISHRDKIGTLWVTTRSGQETFQAISVLNKGQPATIIYELRSTKTQPNFPDVKHPNMPKFKPRVYEITLKDGTQGYVTPILVSSLDQNGRPPIPERRQLPPIIQPPTQQPPTHYYDKGVLVVPNTPRGDFIASPQPVFRNNKRYTLAYRMINWSPTYQAPKRINSIIKRDGTPMEVSSLEVLLSNGTSAIIEPYLIPANKHHTRILRDILKEAHKDKETTYLFKQCLRCCLCPDGFTMKSFKSSTEPSIFLMRRGNYLTPDTEEDLQERITATGINGKDEPCDNCLDADRCTLTCLAKTIFCPVSGPYSLYKGYYQAKTIKDFITDSNNEDFLIENAWGFKPYKPAPVQEKMEEPRASLMQFIKAPVQTTKVLIEEILEQPKPKVQNKNLRQALARIDSK